MCVVTFFMGLIFGGCIGFVVAALCAASGRDREDES